jgi:hypothetical protein
MNERFIRIVGFGLIGNDINNNPYRLVIFKDDKTSAQAEMLVSKRERPLLWGDIEKLEKGRKLPPYRGYITRLNNLDIVVFDNESVEEAFSRQKNQLNIKSKISYLEAEAMREHSQGYITNLTHQNALEIAWKKIDSEASIIKFRAYSGKGKFVWGNWHEIVRK